MKIYDKCYSATEKEQNNNACGNMDEYLKHYAEWKKSYMKEHILYYFLYIMQN